MDIICQANAENFGILWVYGHVKNRIGGQASYVGNGQTIIVSQIIP